MSLLVVLFTEGIVIFASRKKDFFDRTPRNIKIPDLFLSFFQFPDNILCESRYRNPSLRNKRKPAPASVPASIIDKLRTSRSHFHLQNSAWRQVFIYNTDRFTEGQSQLRAQRRLGEVAESGGEDDSKSDKQWRGGGGGVAWSTDAVMDSPVNGSVHRCTPWFAVCTKTHSNRQTPALCVLSAHTHGLKSRCLRSSIYPPKLSRDVGANAFCDFSAFQLENRLSLQR